MHIVKRFFELFREPHTLTVIDPVMGDQGRLYTGYSPLLAEEMASLLPYADILTPNLTEACILAKRPYQPHIEEGELRELCEALSAKGPKKIVISGLERGECLENFVYEGGKEPVILQILGHRDHHSGKNRPSSNSGVSKNSVTECEPTKPAFKKRHIRGNRNMQNLCPSSSFFHLFLFLFLPRLLFLTFLLRYINDTQA